MPDRGGTLTHADAAYPAALRDLHDAPRRLYYRGSLEALALPRVAIVGTRHASPHAIEAARSFGASFARAGLAVISGLAYGVDAAAHEGALEGDGVTIAVLGSGADEPSLFPRGNLALSRRILAARGLILSENPPGTHPQKWDFPKRNRVIAALARATVVVEAPEKSGALITAKYALELGRDLYAVPSDALRASARGSNRLIEFGAPPLIDPHELILTLTGAEAAPRFDASPASPHNQNEAAVLAALGEGPRHVDDLTVITKLPSPVVLATLTALELRGTVHHAGEMRYRLGRG